MNLQGNSGHVDGYSKHAVRARRRSSTLWDSACRPDASRRRASLEETLARPETFPVFSRSDELGVSFSRDAKDETRDREGRRPQKTAERDLDILAQAKRSSHDITTAMRNTVLPAAHARDDTASHIRPTASGETATIKWTDGERSIGDERIEDREKK